MTSTPAEETSMYQDAAQSPETQDISHYFPFLRLPLELRDMIYEYVSSCTPATFISGSRGRLSSASSLCRTSRQIKAEYLKVTRKCSRTVAALVEDLDFRRVCEFLQGQELGWATKIPLQSIKIHLRLTSGVARISEEQRYGLDFWFRWASSYQTDPRMHPDIQYVYSSNTRSADRDDVRNCLDVLKIDKVRDCLRAWHPRCWLYKESARERKKMRRMLRESTRRLLK